MRGDTAFESEATRKVGQARCLPLMLAVPLIWFGSAADLPAAGSGETKELTRGWTPVPLKYHVQKPYDLDLKERYRFDSTNNVHDFWVYFSDKPHEPPPNKTTARTEMRLESFQADERL